MAWRVAIAFLAVILSVSVAAAEKRLALVLGNNSYVHFDSDHQLRKAVNDATAVGDALEKDGFAVIRGNNLSRSQMLDKIYELVGRIEPGDTAFFYFAGHGIALGNGNYLLPSDVPALGDGPASVQELRIASQSLAEADIIADLQQAGAKVSILVLDACRDNPFKHGGTRSVGQERGLGRAPEANGVFSLYSAGFGQAALDALADDDANPNSVFTRVLLPLLTKRGLHLDDLAYEVREQVARLAATTSGHHEQIPAAYDQIIGGRVYLAGPPADDVRQPGPDEVAWSMIKGSSDRQLFADFIARFPKSGLLAQAEARRDELKREQQLAALERPPASAPSAPTVAPALPAAAPASAAPAPPSSSPSCESLVRPERSGESVLSAKIDEALRACSQAAAEHPGDLNLLHWLQVAKEQKAFQAAMNSADSSPATEYLKNYPSGRFRKEVTIRLAALTPAAPPLHCERGKRLQGEKCVVIACPRGSVLGRDGKCDKISVVVGAGERKKGHEPAKQNSGGNCFSFSGEKYC